METNTLETERRVRGVTILGLFLAAGGFVAVDFVLSLAVRFLGLRLPGNPIMLTIAVQWIVVGLVLLVVRAEGKGIRSLGFGGEWDLADLGMVILAPVYMLMASAIVGLIVQFALGVQHTPSLEFLDMVTPKTKLDYPLLTAAAMTAGICEEILFRGYLITRLEAWWGPRWRWLVILLPSAIFGLLHIPSQGVLPAVVLTLTWALPASLIFWKRRKLMPLILAHAWYDFVQFMIVIPLAMRLLKELGQLG